MAKYYIFDTYTRIPLKSSTPKCEANARSTRRNAHAHLCGITCQILLIIAVSIKRHMQVCKHAQTGQSLHCSCTQRMCAHVCTLVCRHVHTFFVCTSSDDSGQCLHVCTHMRTLANTKNGSR